MNGSKISVISDLIGQSDVLMKVFSNHCAELSSRNPVASDGVEPDDPFKWGGVLLKVLMTLYDNSQQVHITTVITILIISS